MLTTISRLLPTVTPTDFRVWDRAKPNGLGVADFEGAIQINICVCGGGGTDGFFSSKMHVLLYQNQRQIYKRRDTAVAFTLLFVRFLEFIYVLRSMGKLYARKMFRGTIEIFLSKCKSP